MRWGRAKTCLLICMGWLFFASAAGFAQNGPAIRVEPLGAPQQDAIGLMSPRATGFSRNFWGRSSALRIDSRLRAIENTGVPASRALFHRILLAETRPPRGAADRSMVLLARIDKLIEMGALDEAEVLAGLAGEPTPDLYERIFDISLLTGRSEAICRQIGEEPEMNLSLSSRIYCAARQGRWQDAAIALRLGAQMGQINAIRAQHLTAFLDPEAPEAEMALPLPEPFDPIDYALRRAIGQTIDASDLPPAFLFENLQRRVSLRERIMAAERLFRAGAFPHPVLFSAYRERPPAASGGLWDRVAAIRTVDIVLEDPETEKVTAVVTLADRALRQVGLRVALAQEYGEALALLPAKLGGNRDMAELLLLAGEPAAAIAWLPEDADYVLNTAFEIGSGHFYDAPSPDLPNDQERLAMAINSAFSGLRGLPSSSDLRNDVLFRTERSGEAILIALKTLDAGNDINPRALETALAALIRAGRQADARNIAVQTLLTDAAHGRQ